MNRRAFITAIGGAAAAAAWPHTARAQQSAIPVIGYLDASAPETSARFAAAFRKGLSEIGYAEGRNVAIEYRWAYNNYDRVVSVIAAMGGTQTALAAKAATTVVPIVFGFGGDPVETGLVASLSRPGGNVTGVVTMNVELAAKRLGLMRELVPAATRFAVLVNPDNPGTASATRAALAAAARAGWQIEFLEVSNNIDLNAAFASLMQMRAEALLTSPEVIFVIRRVQLLTLAARHAMPTIYPSREFAEAGGLMSYGSSYTDMHRQAGVYTGRILKGEKPSDLPVMQPTTFEFVINLQTAQALGIDVPSTLLARADEVIE